MVNFSVNSFKAAAHNGLLPTNKYQVILPGDVSPIFSGPNFSATCKNASLPGKQIMTSERIIGSNVQKMAYGFAVEDVSLVFHITNDMGIKSYFEDWTRLAINTDTDPIKIGYKENYARDITIKQYNKENLLVYTCILEDAFPITINGIDLANDANATAELTIQIAYTKWRSEFDPA